MEPLIVNIFGGPGSGKSTMAARLFSELKEKGIVAELVTEYAKDATWEEAFNKLNNQLYVFAKQHHRIWRVANKVDVIITDSPLLLSLIYGETMSTSFKELVLAEHERYNTLNISLKRTKHYIKVGRSQTEKEARKLDKSIRKMYTSLCGDFDLKVPGRKSSTKLIIKEILKRLSND